MPRYQNFPRARELLVQAPALTPITIGIVPPQILIVGRRQLMPIWPARRRIAHLLADLPRLGVTAPDLLDDLRRRAARRAVGFQHFDHLGFGGDVVAEEPAGDLCVRPLLVSGFDR